MRPWRWLWGDSVSCVWWSELGPRTPMDQPSASGLGGMGGHVSLVTDPLPLQGTLLGCTFPSGNHLHVGDMLFECGPLWPFTWALCRMDSWCGGSARPADASCGHITAPQSPRVWHTVPAVGRPELCPAVKAAWRTGCSQSGTSEQELGAEGGRCSETWRGACVRSEVRLGHLPALRRSPARNRWWPGTQG